MRIFLAKNKNLKKVAKRILKNTYKVEKARKPKEPFKVFSNRFSHLFLGVFFCRNSRLKFASIDHRDIYDSSFKSKMNENKIKKIGQIVLDS